MSEYNGTIARSRDVVPGEQKLITKHTSVTFRLSMICLKLNSTRRSRSARVPATQLAIARHWQVEEAKSRRIAHEESAKSKRRERVSKARRYAGTRFERADSNTARTTCGRSCPILRVHASADKFHGHGLSSPFSLLSSEPIRRSAHTSDRERVTFA